MPEDKSIADRLHDLLTDKLGQDWRRAVSLTLLADALYWFAYLAEQGIAAKRQQYRAAKTMDASAVASLASWTMDLENLISKVQAVLPPKKGGKTGSK
jgi:hypothetical protein